MLFTSLLGAFLLLVAGRTAAAERASEVLCHETRERRLAEEERQKLENQIRQSQKLESLGVLTGGIAHDFNNLLVGVLGYAGLALEELDPAAPARDSIKSIEIASQRAAELANQLLAYSGKGKFVIETLDLSDLVAETSNLIEVSASKTNRVVYNLAGDLPAVKADRGRTSAGRSFAACGVG